MAQKTDVQELVDLSQNTIRKTCIPYY